MDFEFDRNFNAGDYVYIGTNTTTIFQISSVNVTGTYTIVSTASGGSGTNYSVEVPANCADSFLTSISAES